MKGNITRDDFKEVMNVGPSRFVSVVRFFLNRDIYVMNPILFVTPKFVELTTDMVYKEISTRICHLGVSLWRIAHV